METKEINREKELLILDYKVFPSEEKTIQVFEDADYGGAHRYKVKNSIGFNNGKAEYAEEYQTIQFVQKSKDGLITPGLQSEQIAYILLDRVIKLNKVFPSIENEKQIAGLKMFIDACEERVKNRIDRGVMGDLKK